MKLLSRKRLMAAGLLLFQAVNSIGASMAMTSSQGDSGYSFGFRLFNKVCDNVRTPENILLSPSSAYLALSMTANGAERTTLSSMLGTLGVTTSLPQMNTVNQNAIAALKANKSVSLETANGLFVDQKMSVLPGFLQICKQFYSAEVSAVSFADRGSVSQINAWCYNKTHGKIPQILAQSDINPYVFMVLLNALYFRGEWQNKFKVTMTRPGVFTRQDGSATTVDMMHQHIHANYFEGPDFISVELPYSYNAASMFIFLPTKGVPVTQVVKHLNDRIWKDWMNSYRNQYLQLQLPKFKLECRRDFSDDLKSMGMAEAFSAQANFSGMVAPPAKANIGKVIQRTYMNVDEDGTEAAAVTAVTMVGSAAMAPTTAKKFLVDRPFLIALRDNASGQILFVGTVQDPQGR